MKKTLQFLFLLLVSVFAAPDLNAQAVQLRLGVSDDGLDLLVVLESQPACEGSGMSQASFTFRWPEGGTALRENQAVMNRNRPGTVNCQPESAFIPSPTFDYVLCTVEPPGGTNIDLDFAAGSDTLIRVPVDGIGAWEFEDLDGGQIFSAINATYPYVNIQNTSCETADQDPGNSIRVDAVNGETANNLAYAERQTDNDGLLPVELSNFEAEVEDREISLQWETSSETNNAGFAIEYAGLDGQYSEIAFVEGNGTTSEANNYQFAINEFEIGIFKFRLKQVDFDGSYGYSPELDLTVDLPSDMVLDPAYPNPFNPVTNIRFAVKERQNVNLHLFDLQGRLVKNLFEGPMEGGVMKTFRLDAFDLTSGTYIVQLRGEELKKSMTRSILLIK